MPTNSLIHESSPYLLQHAKNPVDWVAWKPRVWEKAKSENKLVIVSIGYSACHWCHVMEHESFEDKEVANFMNAHFLSIKVDREERPDIDQIYMDAVQLITGHGGWPLNAICLPDGRPVYAGTYFQKNQWMQVLRFLQHEFENKYEEMLSRATEITRGIKAMDIIPLEKEGYISKDQYNKILANYETSWDFEKGGRKGAPKFPMPSNLNFLLLYSKIMNNEKAKEAAITTLNKMAEGGIYDQVGGGFARYSVDDEWHIPHFEKMLYDNAQLIETYSLAYQITKSEVYKSVVYNTLSFLDRELKDSSGGYYSALDADSEGEEGKFYCWSYDDLKKNLGNDFYTFKERFDISEHGNFEETNHLVRKNLNGFNDAQEQKWMQSLLEKRAKRIRPGTDDKINTSWNALLLKGLATAYVTFNDPDILSKINELDSFFRQHIIHDEFSISRIFKNGKTTINGFLEDYALLADAYITLYQIRLDESYLNIAKQITDYVIQHFYNPSNSLFYYTSINDDPLIARKIETSDNVIPSSNAVMADVLAYLGHVYHNENYLRISQQMVLNMQKMTHQHTQFYSRWASVEAKLIDTSIEISIVGKDSEMRRVEFGEYYMPQVLFSGSKKESSIPILKDRYQTNETLIYVCINKSCNLPVRSVEEAIDQIKN